MVRPGAIQIFIYRLVLVSGYTGAGYWPSSGRWASMADRYTYIPSTGLFIVIAWGTNELLAKWKYKQPVLWRLSLAVIFILAVLTWLQAGYWRDSISLFGHAVSVTSGNYVAYDNRGTPIMTGRV